jgi:rRNA-processing protein FCF1
MVDVRVPFDTLAHMKVVMDADCLIKLTKAGLKEIVCRAFEIAIPSEVLHEVTANPSEHPEVAVIRQNLSEGRLVELTQPRRAVKGEDATLLAYRAGGYDGIASDDKRFVRKLQVQGVPYITATVFLLLLAKKGAMDPVTALENLTRLAAFVSEDEFTIAKMKLDELQRGGA